MESAGEGFQSLLHPRVDRDCPFLIGLGPFGGETNEALLQVHFGQVRLIILPLRS